MATPLSPWPSPGRDPRRLALRLARRVGLEVEALDRPHLRAAGERVLRCVLRAGEAFAATEEGAVSAGSIGAAREGLAGCRFLLEVLASEGAVARSSLREIAGGIRVLERALPATAEGKRAGRGAW